MVFCNDSRHIEVRNENHKNWQRLRASRPGRGLGQGLRPPKDGCRILLFIQTQRGGKVGTESVKTSGPMKLKTRVLPENWGWTL